MSSKTEVRESFEAQSRSILEPRIAELQAEAKSALAMIARLRARIDYWRGVDQERVRRGIQPGQVIVGEPSVRRDDARPQAC